MSIELRFERDQTGVRWLTCDLGRIEHADPQPELGRIGALMLTTRDYAHKLADEGAEPSCKCAEVTHSATRHGDVIAAHVDYRGRRYSFELLPAHWWDGEGPPVYLGRAL